MPGPQGEHILEPAREKKPPGQIVQAAAPADEAVPAEQVLHDLEPGRLA